MEIVHLVKVTAGRKWFVFLETEDRQHKDSLSAKSRCRLGRYTQHPLFNCPSVVTASLTPLPFRWPLSYSTISFESLKFAVNPCQISPGWDIQLLRSQRMRTYRTDIAFSLWLAGWRQWTVSVFCKSAISPRYMVTTVILLDGLIFIPMRILLRHLYPYSARSHIQGAIGTLVIFPVFEFLRTR